MDEIGTVKGILYGKARIELKRIPQCERCGMCMQATDADTLILDVHNDLGAVPGDRVKIAIRGGNVISASFLVYGIPFIGLVSGSLIGSFAGISLEMDRNISAVTCGFLGLGTGLFITWLIDRRMRKAGHYRPAIVEVLRLQDNR